MFGNTRIAALLSRFGSQVVILRETKTGTDRLNNETGTYGMHDTTLCAQFSPGMDSGLSAGGELSIEGTALAFPLDTDLAVDDRVVLNGAEYEITALVRRRTHVIADGKNIS